MPEIKKPRLVNRGPAGLLARGKADGKIEVQHVDRSKAKRDNIQCEGTVIEIAKLTADPLNARLHPERNMEQIMDSLALYGQRIPLVVRKQGLVVAAGNGRMAGMLQLGWTRCAVSIRPMTDAEFHGYALTDNRSAEFARWDFEAVATVERMLREQGQPMVGWSFEELQALRSAEDFEAPTDFKEFDETIETEHKCPRCGYKFSGGK